MKRTALLLAFGIMAIIAVTGLSLAGNNRNFSVHLSGDEEVPPNNSPAQGQAIFQLSQDGTSFSYKLIVSNIENVRAAHIHLAPAGENGPVIVTLFGGPAIPGPFNGNLAEGTFTAADLSGPMAGQPLSALVEQMNSGGTYVNVHTDQIPGGEIRGQIK